MLLRMTVRAPMLQSLNDPEGCRFMGRAQYAGQVTPFTPPS
jgi:hypothetical protein